MNVEVWDLGLYRFENRQIVPPAEIRVQPALNANFSSAAIDRFPGTANDLLKIQNLSPCLFPPFCKATELTAHITDVGEVDIAANNKARPVSPSHRSKAVRNPKQSFPVFARRVPNNKVASSIETSLPINGFSRMRATVGEALSKSDPGMAFGWSMPSNPLIDSEAITSGQRFQFVCNGWIDKAPILTQIVRINRQTLL